MNASHKKHAKRTGDTKTHSRIKAHRFLQFLSLIVKWYLKRRFLQSTTSMYLYVMIATYCNIFRCEPLLHDFSSDMEKARLHRQVAKVGASFACGRTGTSASDRPGLKEMNIVQRKYLSVSDFRVAKSGNPELAHQGLLGDKVRSVATTCQCSFLCFLSCKTCQAATAMATATIEEHVIACQQTQESA